MILQADLAEILQTKYNVYFSDERLKKHRFIGRDLLQSDGLLELLNLVGTHLQAPHIRVAASLFAKHYSYLLIAGGLFAAVRNHVHLDLSLDRLCLHTNEDWSPSLQLSRTSFSSLQDSLDSLFVRNLRPLFHFLSQTGSIQESVLWAHASFNVHYLFDLWMEEAKEEKQHIEQVFTAFIADTPELGIAFEEMPHPLFPEKSFRLRKKCCLYYCLPGASKCTTCPLLHEEERVDLLRDYHGLTGS